ncbi:MAG: hypothetical protein CMO63_06005 [Verrucomicrobiales bacterium]|nr:hypothetical protein [Verrucomicrobiales bacterium]
MAAFSIFVIGCETAARKTASGVSRLATSAVKTTGKAAGKLAVATVKAGGKVALSAGKSSGKALLELAKAGEVTFVDAATGLVSSIPFVDGLNLKTAIEVAKLDPRIKAFEVVRPSGIIRIGVEQLPKLGRAKLKSGDVIRMVKLASK